MIFHDESPVSCAAGTPRGTYRLAKALGALAVATVATLAVASVSHAGTVQVTKQGTGSGVVTGSVGSLSCGTNCTATVDNGTLLTLTARASAGSRFVRWGGACTSAGTATTCALTVAPTVAVTATFRQADVDFNGDGLADVAIHRRRHGEWWIGLSTGDSFNITRFATSFGNRGRDREQIFVGDFTGDGLTDVAVHDHATGDWFVGRSTGTGFVVERWASGLGNRGRDHENVLVGDFDGDGRADLAIHDRRTGDWFVGRSTGTSFAISRWLTSFGSRGRDHESVFVGDFTGDGRSDLAIHDHSTGTWFVARSTGSAFAVELWASNFGNRGHGRERVYVGDFSGDGRMDVAVHDRARGDWFVGASTGTAFAVDLWVTGLGTRGEGRERARVGDFTGDGRTDVAIHDHHTGDWFVGVSTGSRFVIQLFVSNFGTGGEDEEDVVTGRRHEQEADDRDDEEGIEVEFEGRI